MKKCKHCGKIIADDDKICSRCGETLLSANATEAVTIADAINEKEMSDEEIAYVDIKSHKKIVAFLLSFFLGPLGLQFYYLGFILYGILWPILHLVLIGITVAMGMMPGIVIISFVIINWTVAIAYLCKKNTVDKRGNYLL